MARPAEPDGAAGAPQGHLRVTVAYAAPGTEAIVALTLRAGATAAEAAERSGLVGRLGLDAAALRYAIFGEAARADTPLRDGDRVELTRPLARDPQSARRARARATPLPRAPKAGKPRPQRCGSGKSFECSPRSGAARRFSPRGRAPRGGPAAV